MECRNTKTKDEIIKYEQELKKSIWIHNIIYVVLDVALVTIAILLFIDYIFYLKVKYNLNNHFVLTNTVLTILVFISVGVFCFVVNGHIHYEDQTEILLKIINNPLQLKIVNNELFLEEELIVPDEIIESSENCVEINEYNEIILYTKKE